MAVLSPVKAMSARHSREASFRSMSYTCSHTTAYVMLPTRYRACVLERCNDRIRQMATINLPSKVGSGCMVCVTLVSAVRIMCPVSDGYFTV